MIYSICCQGQKQLPFLKLSRKRFDNKYGKNENGDLGAIVHIDVSNTEFIGVEHNRRYFSDSKGTALPMSEEQLQEKLKAGYKVIVGEYRFRGMSDDGAGVQIKNLLHEYTKQFFARVLKFYPEMYPSVDFVLNNNFVFPHNMIYTTADVFTELQQFIQKVFINIKEIAVPPDTPEHHKGKMKSLIAETILTAWYLHKFKISEIYINNITCFSRDFTEVVDPYYGLNYEQH